MSKDSLAVTASSIWSRLPNEEQYTQQTRGGRLSPSARSNASTASSASTSHRLQHSSAASVAVAASSGRPPQAQAGVRTSSPRGYHLYTQQNGQAPYLQQQQQGGHFTSRDFAPSPRSSASTSGGSFPPTPDSSTSPHDRHAGTKVLPPAGPLPPQGAHHLAPSTTTGATAKRFSLHYSSSLGLYPEEPALEASQAQNVASQPAPTPAPQTAVSPAPSSQPLLAEVFSGNPRPHYRSTQSTSALAPYQQYRPPAPGGSVSVDTSPYPHYPPPLASPPVHPETPGTAPAAARSYFAAPPPPPGPNSGRARSASIAALDRPSSVMPPSAYGATSSEAHHYPGMDAYSYGGGMNGSSGADQHGWKPSGDGPGHISASLPTVSAVGSPSRGSALPHPSSSSVARGGGSGGGGSGGAYSPFGWNEDSAPLPTTAPGSGDREGRSRFRDLWGNTSAGGNGAGLSTSAGSTGGIGMSNMSPFSRDGSKLELDSWSGLSGLKNGGGGGGGGPHGRLLREHSLGAVGTGRKRSDAALWGRPTLLREVEDEDEDGSEEDAPDVFHAPTKSGATSRRHSFAAFDPPNRGATTHQIGFHLPPSSTHDAPSSSAGGGGGFGPLMAPVSSSAWNTQHHGGGGGLGSSAINDDDLAADLNSLHLNLEVAAASNEPPRAAARHLHVGSMPANFPPARTSRALEHSRSPPPPREVPIESNAAPAPAHAQPQPQPQGSSPRATAEPFTPSIGSSVGSRFLLQGLQAPTPLPPATTPVVATASPTLGGGPSPHPQQQQQHQPQQPYQPQPGNRYGPYGQFPPPVPPPITTQHQYFTPATAAPSALSPRGPPPRNGPGAFPGGYGNVPPPHLQQHGAAPLPPPVPPPPQPPLSYFNAPPPPPPGMPQLPQVAAPLTAQAQTDMNLGRGVPLHAIPPGAPLCIVGFKAGRKDLFFCEDPNLHLEEGDLVIVEADRGRDVGKFLKSVTVDEVHKFQQHLVELALGQLASGGGGGGGGGVNPMAGGMTSPASMGMGHDPSGGGQGGTAQLARMTKECQPKRIFAKAGPADTHALLSKAQDEVKALALVRSKVAQKGLPMEILDAEWQWDRRKLTFYYTAETRVDFRELVRELFRIWKTRVWLCCLDQQQPSFDIQ